MRAALVIALAACGRDPAPPASKVQVLWRDVP